MLHIGGRWYGLTSFGQSVFVFSIGLILKTRLCTLCGGWAVTVSALRKYIVNCSCRVFFTVVGDRPWIAFLMDTDIVRWQAVCGVVILLLRREQQLSTTMTNLWARTCVATFFFVRVVWLRVDEMVVVRLVYDALHT